MVEFVNFVEEDIKAAIIEVAAKQEATVVDTDITIEFFKVGYTVKFTKGVLAGIDTKAFGDDLSTIFGRAIVKSIVFFKATEEDFIICFSA